MEQLGFHGPTEVWYYLSSPADVSDSSFYFFFHFSCQIILFRIFLCLFCFMSEVSRSLSGQTTMFTTFLWSRAQIRTNNERAISDCNHHQITQAFINKGLFSSTSNFQYKMHCLQIIHQSCEMQYVNTASFLATKLERMEESWSYLYFCAHFNPFIILLVRRNHLSVRNRLQLNLGQRYFPKIPRVAIFLLTWGTLLQSNYRVGKILFITKTL
jgi:hypothetical protein